VYLIRVYHQILHFKQLIPWIHFHTKIICFIDQIHGFIYYFIIIKYLNSFELFNFQVMILYYLNPILFKINQYS